MNKLVIAMFTAASVVPSLVVADTCSGNVEAYLKGLQVASTNIGVNGEARKKAISNIEHIESLRESNEDCDVSSMIPVLNRANKARLHANKVMSSHK